MSRYRFHPGIIILTVLFLCVAFSINAVEASNEKIATGGTHTLVIRSDGTLWAWGRNVEGELGDGTTIMRISPVRIGIDNDWISIAAGHVHTVALKSDGTVWAWGRNVDGQLGDGSTIDKHSPIQIGIENDWVSVAAGYDHTIAIKSDGTLWAWGQNENGQLGDGTGTIKYSPVQIGFDNNWRSIAGGQDHTVAIKADGTLWAWGWNYNGQLGDGTATTKYSPVRIGTDNNWMSVSAGVLQTVAIKSDGTLWVWGALNSGPQYSPSQIGSDINWTSAHTGAFQAVAMKANGTLWAWGENYHGQLGDGTTIPKYIPVQIRDNDWLSVNTGFDNVIAFKADGTLWAWGRNDGKLGDGTTTSRQSPEQIGPDIFTRAVIFAINAGGEHIDISGISYQADTGDSGSHIASTNAAIGLTSDDILYQTVRFGNFSYNIPLSNGNYAVRLKFAEIYWNEAGRRLFNVSMQGTQVIGNLDIFSKVGKNAAYDVTVPATVSNGILHIDFISVADYAIVSAIEITALFTPPPPPPAGKTVSAVNSGGEQYTDNSGILYKSDTDYSGGHKASTSAVITGTSDSKPYQSVRYGNFAYNIPLANGDYNVTLKFAEIYWNEPGRRVFNVLMQGSQVITDLDIFSEVGKNKAYDVTIPVNVTDGALYINFSSVTDYASVSAIVITQSQEDVVNCSAGDIACLINAINQANSEPGDHTINLAPGTYTLSSVNNITDGSNGLPSITGSIKIVGAGHEATILQRDVNATSTFRIFHVAVSGKLILNGINITNGRLEHNYPEPTLGGAGIYNRGTVNVRACKVLNNTDYSGDRVTLGGGLYNNKGTATIKESIFEGNEVGWEGGGNGGAIYSVGELNIESSLFKHNHNYGGQGGALSAYGNLTIRNSSFISNGGLDNAGGAISFNDGSAEISRSSFESNHADAGAAISIGSTSVMTIVNSTFYGNESAGWGGGIYVYHGSLSITNCTFTKNHDVYYGHTGGIYNLDGIVQIQNTILSGNISPWQGGTECYGTIVSLGNNLISDTNKCSINLQPTDKKADAKFGPLVISEEPGNEYVLLQADSPAIDAGNNEACQEMSTDQVGKPRIMNGKGANICDIGAVEFNSASRGILLDPLILHGISLYLGASDVLRLTSIGGANNWTATADVSDPEWLSFSPTSGTGDAIITFSVDSTRLVPGDYYKHITISAPGTLTPSQELEAFIMISGPRISLNPWTLNFSAIQNTRPLDKTLIISNSGGGTLNWVATADATAPAWLSVSPGTGLANATLTVSVNTAGLLPGTYTKNIRITATNADPVSATVTLTINPPSIVFATNSGDGQYTDSSGISYQTDKYYSGGRFASTTDNISGTSDGTVYQSVRFGNFSYNIPLTNGNYSVKLKFAEIYWDIAGKRVFNVSMQGSQVISNLDIFSKVGKNAAYDVTVPATVSNGWLNINFSSIVDYANVSAIEIIQN